MGFRWIVIPLLTALFAASTFAQAPPASEQLTLTAKSAATWTDGTTTVIQLQGPIKIELDRAKMSAQRAVIWLVPVSQQNLDLQSLQVALIGDARIEQEQVTRTGGELFATALVRGNKYQIVADERVAQDLSGSALYQQAAALRQAQGPATQQVIVPPVELPGTRNAPPTPTPAQTQPAVQRNGSDAPVEASFGSIETIQTDEGSVAAVLGGGVKLIQARATGDLIELQARRAVLFTPLKSLKELAAGNGQPRRFNQMVTAAYLEGDVRIEYLPNRKNTGEQRLMADRVYYEFATDRAVLTNAIIHTADPTRGSPMVARARLIRQLSVGEYRATNMQLSTSSFAVPSLSMAADKLYVRQETSENPDIGSRVVFQGQGVTFQAFDFPFFWLPFASGSLERGEALRSISFGNSNIFGVEAMSEWGLFESLGMLPPRDLDVNYRLDYFSKRGPGFGLNAAYGGGFRTDQTKEPWDFRGQLRSYFIYDHGTDDVGRLPIKPEEGSTMRGMALWEHQHYFPDNWEAYARAGYVSDATFREQWFRRDFETGAPLDVAGYLKHVDQTEAFTFGAEFQPNKVVTTSNMQQENFEIERLPQVQYYRIGDGFANDHLTFFSENSAGGLRFQTSKTPIKDEGFLLPTFSPGRPALGTTGTTKDITWRGDFRQEVDWPLSAGPFRVVPYVFGRYTYYSQQPSEDQRRPRGFLGAGLRASTEIWKTDPTIQSDLFDIHQLRHVIEPQLNLFTSATNVDNTRLFIYDTDVDKINDVSAIQLGVNQRWQTKRGGPGAWRSSDVFSFNFDVDWYANKPPKPVRAPYNFRGMFFPSYPEASIPRDAINADASWRISDNTVVLSDASWNLDKSEIQTIAIGILVRRDTRMSYFIGNRYIGVLDSNITSVHADYELSKKYVISVDQEFDFTHGQNVYSNVSIVRRFDTFYLIGRYFFDEVTGENGFSVNVIPYGFGQGIDTGSFNTFRR